MPTILVVDDEQLLVKGLKRSLEQEGYRVLTAHDGVEALQVFQSEAIDLVVLDVMLPGLGGLEVCARIRREKMTPIIMLTAKGEDVDRIVGLELGADDYVVKPFNTRELVARIRAVLRRVRATDYTAANGIMEIQGLTIDGPKRKVYVRGVEVDLTAKEFDMLHLMVANPGRVYTRENLLEAVWGSAYYSDLRTVDVHIRRLREKIEENPGKPEWVLTKWGVGYYFKEKM
ncbi:MAG: response regulator transcription factor [Firmicutes bacterium]|nr:response regulator transcription factor [Bacillota bacterium]MBU4533348.1 response regulator transcription factor [Bacillota bacterium]MBU4553763.1 response regulator transcription factor [Bacillota bacterium]MBV1727082.1 response regulator transcription factor [Desulforudis sp.]MBV1768624.1 response regulator transcription factor [Desulforudis sp.]